MTNLIWGVYPYWAFTLVFVVPGIRIVLRPHSFRPVARGRVTRPGDCNGPASATLGMSVVTHEVPHVPAHPSSSRRATNGQPCGSPTLPSDMIPTSRL